MGRPAPGKRLPVAAGDCGCRNRICAACAEFIVRQDAALTAFVTMAAKVQQYPVPEDVAAAMELALAIAKGVRG
jgi:hypothetical protein